jgi:hypothetical protein
VKNQIETELERLEKKNEERSLKKVSKNKYKNLVGGGSR